MKALAGKVALVTGSSKGIGAGIAIMFAAAGARVVVNYLHDEVGAEDVVSDIVEAGGEAIAVQADVSRADHVKRLFATAYTEYGKPDIVVNNAGVFHRSPFSNITEAEMQQQFAVNVFGTLLVSQQAVEYFGDGGGCIINLSAVSSKNVAPGAVLYAATKGAIDSITQGLSRELGPKNIRVNAIAPGCIITEGLLASEMLKPEFKAQLIAMTPLGRFGIPEDVARVALFLASEEATYVSGERLLTSGGWR
ncbi:SDR family oxidoreductase [Erwiniaceae bacterium BAC15a-03b]|uniref:SDR family oxidoreductase n=1 Tax=Winslowiella arboricola TaxID=2978220 RepID=A0A9J6PJ18_9GAMM|nr:SDR family oxidoreductase [Winslowiella arboricola]MCU5773394.1 SDR family oxidoreductase [Winslowiella arboricola]MCU5776718.1 SDR family oxidoreductase [Winslowiella arboricola]